jgi:DNA-binding LytR/AlgR family response regulator
MARFVPSAGEADQAMDVGAPESNRETPPLRALVAHRRGRHRLILIEEIHRIEASGNYVRVHVEGGAYLVRSTMQLLETRLSSQGFVRVHRGVLVPVRQMLEITGAQGSAHRLVLRDGSTVRVSREIWQRLRSQPGILLSPQLVDGD